MSNHSHLIRPIFMNIKVYKIRHKETGLFFKPREFSYRPQQYPNLSKGGKLYHAMPSFDWLYGNKEDWEIVEYILIEKEIIYFE